MVVAKVLAASSAVPMAPARVLHVAAVAPAARVMPQPVAPVVARAAAPVVPLSPVAAAAAASVEGAADTSNVAPAAAVDEWVLVDPGSSSAATAESAVVTTETAANGSVPVGGSTADDVPVCVICQDSILRAQEVTALWCTHSFHTACLGEWRLCPRKGQLCCPYRCETSLDRLAQHGMRLGPIMHSKRWLSKEI